MKFTGVPPLAMSEITRRYRTTLLYLPLSGKVHMHRRPEDWRLAKIDGVSKDPHSMPEMFHIFVSLNSFPACPNIGFSCEITIERKSCILASIKGKTSVKGSIVKVWSTFERTRQNVEHYYSFF